MKTAFERFKAFVYDDTPDGCWVWIGSTYWHGYGSFSIARSTNTYAHRWAFEHFIGPIPKGLKVLHLCDGRTCVNPDHLFLGTQADNIHDMWAKGRQKTPFKSGQANIRCRLTDEQIRQIRDSSISPRDLSLQFGVTPQYISAVKRMEYRK